MKKSTRKVLEDACDFARTVGEFSLFDEKYSFYREYTSVRDSVWLALREMFGHKVADAIVKGSV